MKKRSLPWHLIREEYFTGVKPSDIAMKYKVKAKLISDRAYREGWKREKAKIDEIIIQDIEDRIKKETLASASDIDKRHHQDLKLFYELASIKFKEALMTDNASNMRSSWKILFDIIALQRKIYYLNSQNSEPESKPTLVDYLQEAWRIKNEEDAIKGNGE